MKRVRRLSIYNLLVVSGSWMNAFDNPWFIVQFGRENATQRICLVDQSISYWNTRQEPGSQAKSSQL